MREDGLVLGHLAKANAEQTGGAHRFDPSERERLLDFLEVPEADRETDYANDLFDNESTLARRRMSRSPATPATSVSDAVPVLAAAAGQIWIATGHSLFRIDTEGRLVRLADRSARIFHMVAARGALLVGEGNRLTFWPDDSGRARSIAIESAVDRVALSTSARRIAWTAGTTVTWSEDPLAGASTGASNALGGAVPLRVFEAPAEIGDLSYCGEDLIVSLVRDLLILPADRQPQMRPRRIQAKRMLCSEDPQSPWLAWGPGLYLSTDQGRNWSSLALPDATEPLDAAISAHHLWLATQGGLYTFIEQGGGASPSELTAHAHLGRRRTVGKAAASWSAWMPKVTLQGQAAFAPGSQQWQALAFATFPIQVQARHEPPISLTVAAMEDDVGETAVMRRKTHTSPPRDTDVPCLIEAKRKAVTLAMAEPERARSYVTRAGHAAWLPELRFLVARRYGRSESLDLNTSSTALASPLGIDTVNDIRYEARVTWDLARLIFSPEELAAQSQATHMAELRRDIETTMNRLYFERRRILVESLGEHAAESHRELRTTEIESELDAMSAGIFSTCLSGKAVGER
jgi:hypothetical protein